MNSWLNRLCMPRVAARVLVLGAVVTAVAVADDSTFTSSAGVGNVSGAQIYSQICQGCHMPAGEGAVGAGHYPKLAGDPDSDTARSPENAESWSLADARRAE